MSLDFMESEIAGLRAKAADLADSYARSQAEISTDSNLTDAGKRDALAPLHEDMQTKVTALLHEERAVVKRKKESLEKSLFGTGGSTADISRYREAQSIAAQLTDSDEAHDRYVSALRSDDTTLAQAVFSRAVTRGWSNITDDYLQRNPSAKTALADLEGIRRYEQNTLSSTLHYMTPGLSTAPAAMPVAISSGEMAAFFSGGSQGRSQT